MSCILDISQDSEVGKEEIPGVGGGSTQARAFPSFVFQRIYCADLKACGSWRSSSARQLGSHGAELKAGPPAVCGLSGRTESQ